MKTMQDLLPVSPNAPYGDYLTVRLLRIFAGIMFAVVGLIDVRPALAQVVFFNDFETNTDGFTPSGSLTNVTRVSLPIDSGGPTSTNTSLWLGKNGYGIAKSGTAEEILTLTVSNLTVGAAYDVAFDLLIGDSWDGAAVTYGPDTWRFAVDNRRLVDTIFANGKQGVNLGAYSPQRYSDTNYVTPNGPDVERFTGAEAFWSANQNYNYSNDYAIYYFGHGTGNPPLCFIATNSTARLEFVRYGNTTDNPYEYWALDNVRVAPTIRPVLAIHGLTNRLVLSWTTNAFGFHVETTTNLPGGAAWVTLPATLSVVGDAFTVTNLLSANNMFCRLAK